MRPQLFPTLFLVGLLSAAASIAQAQTDSLAVGPGTRARLRGSVLGPGWHSGRLTKVTVPGPIAGGVECLAFVASPDSSRSVAISPSDSLEVWVAGKWAGLSRAKRAELSCRLA
jgi:hypothetical protein